MAEQIGVDGQAAPSFVWESKAEQPPAVQSATEPERRSVVAAAAAGSAEPPEGDDPGFPTFGKDKTERKQQVVGATTEDVILHPEEDIVLITNQPDDLSIGREIPFVSGQDGMPNWTEQQIAEARRPRIEDDNAKINKAAEELVKTVKGS